MQITLKDLFAFTTVCASLAWVVGYTGINDAVVWHFTFASILAIAFFYMAIDEYRQQFAIMIPVPFILCVCFWSLGIFVQAVFLLCVAAVIFSDVSEWSWRRTFWFASVSVLLGIAVNLLPGLALTRGLYQLRAKYPVQNLEPRLEYERKHVNGKLELPPKLSIAVASSLAPKAVSTRNSREFHLKELHDRKHELFVRSLGFGFMPTAVFRAEDLELPPLANVPFDAISSQYPTFSSLSYDDVVFDMRGVSLRDLHSACRFDFTIPASFGGVLEPRKQTTGFVEHGFRLSPMRGLADPKSITIHRLELVSLLKFSEPRVYVLDHLPRMDQLSRDDVVTRPLDDFETAALKQLWTEEDVVVEPTSGGYRMLGSLRAQQNCCLCHHVAPGTLLGAFSYDLTSTTDQEILLQPLPSQPAAR